MPENRLFDLRFLELDPKMKILSQDLPKHLSIINLDDNSLVKLELFHAVCLDLILKKTNHLELIKTLNHQFSLSDEESSLQTSRLIDFLINKNILKRL